MGFIAGKCGNCAALGTGYTAPSYSDRQLEQATVTGLNARGGIAGRKITPVFAEVDTASSNWNTDYQAACSTFTEDHHVAVVLGYSFLYAENLAACLSKAGIVWINGGYSSGDLQVYTRNPLYFTSIMPVLDLELVISVSSAVVDGWVTPKNRLGILTSTCGIDVRSFNNSLKPYLKRQHLQLVSTQTISCPNGATDAGSAAAAVQNAQLKMRSDNVDTVIITGIPLVLFGENAESQHWNPHYVVYGGGGGYEPYLPADQLKNIHAAGWLPTFDLNTTQYPPLTAPQRTCKALITAGGADIQQSNYNSAFIACDGVLLYARAVIQAQGDASPVPVTRALESLGTSYASAATLNSATSLTSGNHGAPQVYRTQTYQDACGCFKYVGPARPLVMP